MPHVLLRLSDSGAPITNNCDSHGVLILPALSCEIPKAPLPLYTLTFHLNAGSAVTYNGLLFHNFPSSHSAPFVRDQYTAHLINPSHAHDIEIVVPVFIPGTFSFYIEYADTHHGLTKTETHYVSVPPVLDIPVNSINVELVVSKWIGPIRRWDSFLARVAAKGYNMVHFTPLQQRGASNSPYSIADQLRFDPLLFKSNEEAIKTIQTTLSKNNLLSMTDVVWNHTASDSQWIRELPDAGYNALTAPHLQSAIELDALLIDFSNSLPKYSVSQTVSSSADIVKIMAALKTVLTQAKFWQYHVFEKDETIEEMVALKSVEPCDSLHNLNSSSLLEIARFALKSCTMKPHYVFESRFSNRLDPQKLLALVKASLHPSPSLDEIKSKASQIIDEINAPLYAQYDDDFATICSQVEGRIRYMRLDPDGPQMGPVTSEHPLFEPYFTRFTDSNNVQHALANNGWIWGGNPLVDFALAQSRAYWRREVIVWGDCIKLRYGSGPKDSASLWHRMIKYTQLCASTFDAFRLDNCHLTPLHVGELLLDVARHSNPNLYVVAELFLGLEIMDKVFVERLGINSLIREAMQASDVSELSLLVHKHGGRPIGSITWLPMDSLAYPAYCKPQTTQQLGSYSELNIPIVLDALLPHALFMDCTHDNETPAQKRTVEDLLPNAALVAFCASAIGSVYGYDEMYPKLLDIVGETRLYDSEVENGIGAVKAQLYAIRHKIGIETVDPARDNEMYIHHEGQYITIQRTNARTGNGWFLIARTKFHASCEPQQLSPCTLAGTTVNPEFAYTLRRSGDFVDDKQRLTGIPVVVEKMVMPQVTQDSKNGSIIHTSDAQFPPGSIAVFSTQMNGVNAELDEFVREGAIEASLELDYCDLNALLYRCEGEERDASAGKDAPYTIPGYGSLVYSGLQGWASVLCSIINHNDLAHPLCDHLRDGSWAFEYIWTRLSKYSTPGLDKFQAWLKERSGAVSGVPYFLRPHYFALLVGVAFEAARFRALSMMTPEIQHGTAFVQALALTSVQMVGHMNSTSLIAREQVPCIAAGLPHFSSGYMRCWGRDVFISFRGLFLVTGRFEEAKRHILGFAQTLKHGLIPNLLDAGRNPRYNARDAAWFFFEAVQQYVLMVPRGSDILKERVARRFPLDDTWIPVDDPRAFSYELLITEILYEILLRHAGGIEYREANAGPLLDSQMLEEGFDVKVSVDWSTGLIHGGLQYNCGTWMDKMGESARAGNRGVPGTPRDGAAVELQGLLKSSLRFVNALNERGLFPHQDVLKPDGSRISLVEWESLVLQNFERCFYVPLDAAQDDEYEIDAKIVNRRGIYKDLYRSGKEYEDYQLRPNFAIAMCVAPELFVAEHAKSAIEISNRVLRGPVGMCTLDPSDWNYRPYYINGIDNDDFATSKGRNYHQGPEWVWCFGYFLRAYHQFALANTATDDKIAVISRMLRGHKEWIHNSVWAGLTELTNKDGELCEDSSPTQAWSTSCLLDFFHDAKRD